MIDAQKRAGQIFILRSSSEEELGKGGMRRIYKAYDRDS
jgi:hypothetical protein